VSGTRGCEGQLFGDKYGIMNCWIVPIAESHGCPQIRIDMTNGKGLFRLIGTISCLLAIGMSISADASWFGLGGDKGATVEILQTTNISSKVTAIGGLPIVFIKGVSDDGSVVVGQFRIKQAPNKVQIFRYTQSSGVENLGSMGGKGMGYNDLCISADGLVIAGTFYIENEGSHVFRYTQSAGFQDLGTMGKKGISVKAISADGSVIVGDFYNSPTEYPMLYHAFRYSQSQGFEDIGAMSTESTHARGISADGSLIVGSIDIGTSSKSAVRNISSHVFRYSRSDGMQDLGVAGSGDNAFASGISNDGDVIVGNGRFIFGFIVSFYENSYVFMYTKKGGMQKLTGIGGKWPGVTRISGDGTKLIGSYSDSNRESYIYTAKIVYQ
jgi:probable HAF family extracellular repeat protein